MSPAELLKKSLQKATNTFELEGVLEVELEHPNDLANGDYSSNIAMKLAGKLKRNPFEVAEQIAQHLKNQTELESVVESIEVAKPGFINFKLTSEYLAQLISKVDSNFGKNETLKNKKAIVEYTDPNPFKVLHIGHLMSNTIGESLARVIEWSGAEIKRACYQGDVGMHVAKTLWGLMDMGLEKIPKGDSLNDQVAYLGKAYAHGSSVYEEGSEEQKTEIKKINKQVYEKSEEKINEIYAWGRQVSLDYFEIQYKQLGTDFDFYFYESEVAGTGREIVKKYLEQGVFEESQGAVIFPGEKHGLHTRVFLNSEGLPTYEAKELGLAKIKHETYTYDLSVVVTGNEINEYFKVLLKVMSIIFPELSTKTTHVGHGMLRLPSGKMSSRTGTVMAAEDLINQAVEKAKEKESEGDKNVYAKIAIGAIKFSVLSQSAGSDIIFDFEKSLSFDGDSGPYLQYTQARCLSVLRKAESEKITLSQGLPQNWQTTEVERFLYRFPEVVQTSLKENSTHHIANYLISLARSFNSFYGNTKIVDAADQSSGYKLSIVKATAQVLKKGLWLLGIEAPEKM